MSNDEAIVDILDAAKEGNHDTLESLLTGVPHKDERLVKARDDTYATPLVLAAKGDFLKCCSILLEHNAEVDACDQDGRTALSFASEHGKDPLCTKLLDNLATVNLADNKANTPLHYAAKEGNLKVVQLLVRRDADISQLNDNNETPRILANKGKHFVVFKTLLEFANSRRVAALEDAADVVKRVTTLPMVNDEPGQKGAVSKAAPK